MIATASPSNKMVQAQLGNVKAIMTCKEVNNNSADSARLGSARLGSLAVFLRGSAVGKLGLLELCKGGRFPI